MYKIESADINDTYFIAEYKNKTIKGTGLVNSGWDNIPHGIEKLTIHVSNDIIINIPPIFSEYLHLIEVSQSILNGEKVFHYMYIYCKFNDKVISYKISLRLTEKENIGDILVAKAKDINSKHWKKACQLQ